MFASIFYKNVAGIETNVFFVLSKILQIIMQNRATKKEN